MIILTPKLLPIDNYVKQRIKINVKIMFCFCGGNGLQYSVLALLGIIVYASMEKLQLKIGGGRGSDALFLIMPHF